MPFYKSYKKYRGKRRMFPRRKRYSKSSSKSWSGFAWDLAKKAATGVVKAYVNTERKYFDVAPAAQLPGTTGFVNHLSAVPLGTGATERDGRQFKATNLFCRLVMTLDPSSVADAFRILIVMAKTDTAPAVTDVLTSSNTLAPRNLNEIRDYKVLSDKTYNLDAVKSQQIQTTLSIPMSHKIQFNAADTTGQATPEWGHIYMIAVGREDTYKTSILYWSRLRYIDN